MYVKVATEHTVLGQCMWIKIMELHRCIVDATRIQVDERSVSTSKGSVRIQEQESIE